MWISKNTHSPLPGTFLALLVSLSPWILADETEVLDRIVAVINEDVITELELEREVETIIAQLQAERGSLPSQDVIERQVLERLIIKRLQLQLAERSGLSVDDNTLNQALRRFAQSNNLTLTQLREVLEADGYAFKNFRENMRQEITINRLRTREIDDRITVTEQEVDAFLEAQAREGVADEREFRLGHILIEVPEAASPEQIQEARDRATQILEALRGGADFRETAIARSDGQQALEGGDLGWRTLGQIPTLFVDEVVDMRAGEVSELIRSASGFHIIKLTDVRGEQRHMVTQTKVRHILIRTDEFTSDRDAMLKLLDFRSRILEGADFASLARAESEDTPSALKGGDLGWVEPGSMVPEFEQTMNQTKVGKVSKPFRTQYGWHILQVVDRRDYDSTDELKRRQAREQVRRRKIEEELALWLRRLRDEAYVDYRLE